MFLVANFQNHLSPSKGPGFADFGHRSQSIRGYDALADCGLALRSGGSPDLLASLYSNSQMVEDTWFSGPGRFRLLRCMDE